MMQVKQIASKDCYDLILNHHYAKRIPCIQFAFGLFEDEVLVGCVTFGQPASPWIKVSMFGRESGIELLELNRLVILTSTKNSASFLIGNAIKKLNKKIALVSYADCGVGHVGYVYQATNWKFGGTSKPRTDIFSESGHARHHGSDPTKRQARSAKNRYWLCRDKLQAKVCKWEALPYPKGVSLHTV